MMAERAWSYAMQLRQEANTEPRKKFHLISRLRKATTYALQLQALCEVTIFLYQVANQTTGITVLLPIQLLHAVQEVSGWYLYNRSLCAHSKKWVLQIKYTAFLQHALHFRVIYLTFC
jgi:hypothetical protein